MWPRRTTIASWLSPTRFWLFLPALAPSTVLAQSVLPQVFCAAGGATFTTLLSNQCRTMVIAAKGGGEMRNVRLELIELVP
jgi:hypothetical protein